MFRQLFRILLVATLAHWLVTPAWAIAKAEQSALTINVVPGSAQPAKPAAEHGSHRSPEKTYYGAKQFSKQTMIGLFIVAVIALVVKPLKVEDTHPTFVATALIISSSLVLLLLRESLHDNYTKLLLLVVLFLLGLPYLIGAAKLTASIYSGNVTRYRVFALGMACLVPVMMVVSCNSR